MQESSVLTWVCQAVHALFEASELYDPGKAGESIFDIVVEKELVCQRIKHIFVPESDVKLTQIVQALQL